MEDFRAFKKEELENPKIYNDISKKVEEALTFGYAIGGEEISKMIILKVRLDRSLKILKSSLEPDWYEKYYNLLVKLRFFTLEDLSDNAVISLFGKHTILAFRDELLLSNLENKIRTKLLGKQINDRDLLLDDIRKSLKENEEIIGAADTTIEIGENKLKPYLKNWLQDYDRVVGAGKHGKLEISDYLFKNKNVRKLSSDERKLLKQILEFYEKLKLKINDPDSFSSYSLPTYDIKSVGTGFKRRFMPRTGTMPSLEKKSDQESRVERPELEEKREKLLYQRPSDLSPGPMTQAPTISKKDIVPQKDQEVAVPARKKPKISQPASALEEEKKKKFKNLKPIPPDALRKLSAPQGLSKLNSQDFRSLGKDSKSAGDFLLNRIKKLSSSSPVERESCKNFLRQSELYKIYLSQGREVLDAKESMSKIIAQRKEAKKEYLSEEEFEVLRKVFKAI